MSATVIPLHPSRPPVPGPEVAIADMAAALGRAEVALHQSGDTARTQRIEIADLRDKLDAARAERDARLTCADARAFAIVALAVGVLLGSAIASFAAPMQERGEVCLALIANADAHATSVIPDWPRGWSAVPTDEQQDAIFAADGEGDPDAVAALEIFGQAMDLGCW